MMMAWVKGLGIAVAALALLWLLGAAWGHLRWQGLTKALHDGLQQARQASKSTPIDPRAVDTLPAPVQRYLRAVLPGDARRIAALTMRQQGTLDLGEREPQWKAFSAAHHAVTRRPGFVWDARTPLAPGLVAHVHDAYVAGEGLLEVAIGGLVGIARQRGGDEMAQGELMRYLAESPWYPTALLPGEGVRWDAIDDRSARATLTDGAVTVSLVFTFDGQGLVETVRAEARGRIEGGQVVLRPWEGRWSDWQRRDGLLVPTAGEVAWLLPAEAGGRKTYWRGRVTAIDFELAP